VPGKAPAKTSKKSDSDEPKIHVFKLDSFRDTSKLHEFCSVDSVPVLQCDSCMKM